MKHQHLSWFALSSDGRCGICFWSRVFYCCNVTMLVKGLKVEVRVSEFIQRIYCRLTLKALRYGSHSFTCKVHCICLYLVSVHQMAPRTDWCDRHLISAWYSFIHPERMKGWVDLVGWSIVATVYPHKWSLVSCRSRAGHGKFAGHRPTLPL